MDKPELRFYYCDGKKECNKSVTCHLNGGDCYHTTSIRHKKYKDHLFEKEKHDCTRTYYWEVMTK